MNNDIKPRVSFAAQQRKDYIRAIVVAPVVLVLVWVAVCAFLLAFGN